MSKLEISWAYRVLDHFWHFFCEVGLTLGNIDKSRIIHIRGQRGFHDDEYSMSVLCACLKPVSPKFLQ